MGTVSAKDLLQSLDKARDIGLVEEPFDVCGHSMVVRNLRPTEIEAVLEVCKGSEDLAYVNAYQREHAARGIVELDGFDLRQVDYIEDEEPDPKRPGHTKKVKIERHLWLAEKLVSTWSQDVIFTIYRKIGDCNTQAEALAKEGVVFLKDDETPNDKLRRILGDASELLDEIPQTLLNSTLEEFGLVRRSTLNELRAADERLNRLRDEEIARERAAMEAEDSATAEVPVEEEPPPPPPPVVRARDIMATRVPLNQVAAPPPDPPRAAPQQAAPVAVTPARSAAPVTSARAREYQALEADADASGAGVLGELADLSAVQRPTEVAELGTRQKIDPEKQAREVAAIIDQPPPAGINPRFRAPPRG